LETGDGFYKDMNGNLCSKGQKQRIHNVKEENGTILVQLNHSGELESDHFAFLEFYKMKREQTE